MFDFDFLLYVHMSRIVNSGTQDGKYMQASTKTTTQATTEKTLSWITARRQWTMCISTSKVTVLMVT